MQDLLPPLVADVPISVSHVAPNTKLPRGCAENSAGPLALPAQGVAR